MLAWHEREPEKEKSLWQMKKKQLCRTMFHVLQDLVIGNRQKNRTFWERTATHYNNNRPLCCPRHLAKSLETKWGAIKHVWQNFVTNSGCSQQEQ
jgi:hypothetical protein